MLERTPVCPEGRLPEWLWPLLGAYCPLCRSRLVRFRAFGDPRRRNARCPSCESLERHRFAWLYCEWRSDLFDGLSKRLLHVAPEAQVKLRLSEEPTLEYVSVDLESPLAAVKMDLTDLRFADGAFDVVWCSHVLEHVRDDRRALRELRRVLRAGGWALLQVPIQGEETREDPAVVAPEERRRLYGQHDHVRQYGHDFADRVREAGFEVEVVRLEAELSDWRRRQFGIGRHEELFICRPGVVDVERR